MSKKIPFFKNLLFLLLTLFSASSLWAKEKAGIKSISLSEKAEGKIDLQKENFSIQKTFKAKADFTGISTALDFKSQSFYLLNEGWDSSSFDEIFFPPYYDPVFQIKINFKEISRLARISGEESSFILPLTFQFGNLNLGGAFSQINSPFLKSPSNGCYSFSTFPQSLSASKASPSSQTKAIGQLTSLDFSKKLGGKERKGRAAKAVTSEEKMEAGHHGKVKSFQNKQKAGFTEKSNNCEGRTQSSDQAQVVISESKTLTCQTGQAEKENITSFHTYKTSPLLNWQLSFFSDIDENYAFNSNFSISAEQIKGGLSFSSFSYSVSNQKSSWFSQYQFFPPQRRFFTSSDLSFSSPFFKTKNIVNTYQTSAGLEMVPVLEHFSILETGPVQKKVPGLTFKSENEISFPKISFAYRSNEREPRDKNIGNSKNDMQQKNSSAGKSDDPEKISVTCKSDDPENTNGAKKKASPEKNSGASKSDDPEKISVTCKNEGPEKISVTCKSEGYFYTDLLFGFFTTGEKYFFTPKGKVIGAQRDIFISPQFNLVLPAYKSKTKVSFFALVQEKAKDQYFVTITENSKSVEKEESVNLPFMSENSEDGGKIDEKDVARESEENTEDYFSENLLSQAGDSNSNPKNLKISFGCENKNKKSLVKFSFMTKNILLTEKEPFLLWENAEISASSSFSQLFYPYIKGSFSFSAKKLWMEDEKSQFKYKASLSALPDRKKEVCLSASADFKSQEENFELSAIKTGISWNHAFEKCKLSLWGNLKVAF